MPTIKTGKKVAKRSRKRSTKKPAAKKVVKLDCFACRVVGMQGVPHVPTCKAGATSTMKRAAQLLKDLRPHIGSSDDEEENECWEGEDFEAEPFDLHDLIVNLTTLAMAQAETVGVDLAKLFTPKGA
jgi:hypothetical protein